MKENHNIDDIFVVNEGKSYACYFFMLNFRKSFKEKYKMSAKKKKNNWMKTITNSLALLREYFRSLTTLLSLKSPGTQN